MQVISRFVVAHLLETSGALSPDGVIISIGNPGWSKDDLSVSDLSLVEQEKRAWSRMSVFAAQMLRDSSVLDAITLEQNMRYGHRTFHLNPGLVASETFPYAALPFLVSFARRLAVLTPMAAKPDEYADVPVFVGDIRQDPTDARSPCSPRNRRGSAAADSWIRTLVRSGQGSGRRTRRTEKRCGSLWRRPLGQRTC